MLSSLTARLVAIVGLLVLTTNGAAQPTIISNPAAREAVIRRLVAAAMQRANHTVRYEPAYVAIPYPAGDVPAETGVCTDEIIRSYRAVGIDLQKEVHEDMSANFSLYPRKRGRRRPDTNIDHRRVPNLQVFFSRQGETLSITSEARDYQPGDIVTWDLGGGLTHIGIVVDLKAEDARERHMILHNIGAGPKLEDVLFKWKITGHYRYYGPETLGVASIVAPRRRAVHRAYPPPLQSTHPVYSMATQLAELLRMQNIPIRAVYGSKMDGFFPATRAAFFRTEDERVFEVIFFPEANGAERVKLQEECCRGGLIKYSFHREAMNQTRGLMSSKREYYVAKGKWLMMTRDQKLREELQYAVNGSALRPLTH